MLLPEQGENVQKAWKRTQMSPSGEGSHLFKRKQDGNKKTQIGMKVPASSSGLRVRRPRPPNTGAQGRPPQRVSGATWTSRTSEPCASSPLQNPWQAFHAIKPLPTPWPIAPPRVLTQTIAKETIYHKLLLKRSLVFLQPLDQMSRLDIPKTKRS